MTLEQLQALGAYVIGQNVDIYHEGKHKRIGYLASGSNELSLTPEGVEFEMEVNVVDLSPEPTVEPIPVPVKKVAAKKVAAKKVASAEDDVVQAAGVDAEQNAALDLAEASDE